MITVRFRWRWHLPPIWLKFLFCMVVMGAASLVALPTHWSISLAGVQKIAQQLHLPQAEKIPFSVSGNKFVLSRQIKEKTYTTDLPIHYGLDIQGGTEVVLAVDMQSISADDRPTALHSVEEIIRKRVDSTGVNEPVIRSSTLGSQYRVLVDLPGVHQPEAALKLIGQTAQLDFRAPDASFSAENAASESSAVYLGHFKPTGLTGEKLKRATLAFDPNTGSPTVSIEFNEEGAQQFTSLTEKNVGKPLAIYLDDRPLSLPIVNQAIYGGRAIITGNFKVEDAQALIAQLNAGALPVPISILEQSTIGPTLGSDSLHKSLLAGGVGIMLVMVFMVLLYGWWGVVADIGLVAYAILTLAFYKGIPITLSLPGIAGLILSVGMALDANILTFAHLREELRAGKSWSIALKRAFRHSWEAIKGANMATLAISFILYNPFNWGVLHTSGPVRGFAATLALGILVSLFTGVFFSRVLLQIFLEAPEKENI